MTTKQQWAENKDEINKRRKEKYINMSSEEKLAYREKENKRLRDHYHNPKNYETRRETIRRSQRKIRETCLMAYSSPEIKCICCGEKEIMFMAIDHINGGRNCEEKTRKLINEVGYGSNLYTYLKKNNFPEGFQVLCHNCNLAKGFYGKCPHGNCQ